MDNRRPRTAVQQQRDYIEDMGNWARFFSLFAAIGAIGSVVTILNRDSSGALSFGMVTLTVAMLIFAARSLMQKHRAEQNLIRLGYDPKDEVK